MVRSTPVRITLAPLVLYLFLGRYALGPPTPAAAQTTAPTTVAASSESIKRTRTIADLGFPDGISLQGTQGEYDLYFDVPLREYAESAHMRVDAQFASTLQPASGITILINGSPQATLSRRTANAKGWAGVDIPVNIGTLQSDYVRVTLRYSVVNDTDVCIDQRLGQGFIRIGEDTGFTYDIPSKRAASVSGMWALLPRAIRIGVPHRALSDAEFSAAYMLSSGLQRRGHVVTIAPLSADADIAIARAGELSAWSQIADGKDMGASGSMVLFGSGARRILGVVADYENAASKLLNREWRAPSGLATVDIVNAVNTNGGGNGRSLAELGVSAGRRVFTDRATWSIPISLRQMPVGQRPSRLRLNLVSSGASAADPVVLNTYLNSTLIQSDRIAATGHMQSVMIDLPPNLVQTYNDVQVEALRAGGGGKCDAKQMAYPMEIAGTSMIETEKVRGASHGFRDMALHMGDSLTVYVERSLASDPAPILRQMLQLSLSFWNDDVVPRQVIFAADIALKPSGSFVLYSRTAPAHLKAPLEIKGNRLKLRAVSSDPVLANLNRLDKWTVLQTAELNDQYGLWIAPAMQEAQFPGGLAGLGTEDISLIDASGRTFRFHSTEREVFDLSGTDRAGFAASLRTYRISLFIVGWLIITALVVYLAVLTQRHRQ